MKHLYVAGALALAGTIHAQAQTLAVGPLDVPRAAVAKREAIPALLTAEGTAALAIGLPGPSLKELSSFKSANAPVAANIKAARAQKGAPLKIGYARTVPGGAQPLDLAALDWNPVAGGSAARITVNSPGAAALRLGLSLKSAPAGVSVRFAGGTPGAQVFGPYGAMTIAATALYWSPVLEGDTATMEVFLPDGVAPSSVALAVPSVGHMLLAGAALKSLGNAKAWSILSGIGAAESCEKDIKCVAPSAALDAQAAAVAMIVLSDNRYVYQCTATLVNDSTGTRTPYLYTANHCLAADAAAVPRNTPAEMAATINTYWFFDATACASVSVPPYVQVAGGAALLGRGDDYDWALVRMNNPPPDGARFSAWRATALQPADLISVVHHPMGDLKKYSEGSVLNYSTYSDGSSFITAGYSSGVTESGSSGSGLITLNQAGGYYELRGGLYGGSSDCSVKNGNDDYSRLDLALPLITQYLTPDAANPKQTRATVEFYHHDLNDYFITADPFETNCLDTGCHTGWQRTGLRFLSYADPSLAPPGATPVCRFYVTPQYGDSHFYSADPAECAQTAVKFQGTWIEESPNLFYIQTPNKNTGACPNNTHPIYRFVNKANPLHHRYTAEVDVRNCLIYGQDSTDQNIAIDLNCTANVGEWIQEGYGTPPDAPVMCSPDN